MIEIFILIIIGVILILNSEELNYYMYNEGTMSTTYNDNSINTTLITGGKMSSKNEASTDIVTTGPFIVLPVSLFESTEALKYSTIYIVEDPVYFTKYKFHNAKLLLHRMSMKSYFDYLSSKLNSKQKIKYIEYVKTNEFYKSLDTATVYDPVDDSVMRKLKKIKNLTVLETPAFLTTTADINEYLGSLGTGKKLSHDTSFYRYQRRRLNVLVDSDGKPTTIEKSKDVSPKWTYDSENREKFPEGQTEPIIRRPLTESNKYYKEALGYIKKNFSSKGTLSNYGSVEHFVYPIDHAGAKRNLRNFFNKNFKNFGVYQDASSKNIVFGYHSVISSSLNCGLLTPDYVLREAIKYAKDNKIPMNSLEGFIRQLIGWREYCRVLYNHDGFNKAATKNYFNSKNKLKSTWWTGETTLTPIDDIIKTVDKYAYAHHIERLMYLSSVMLMCMIDPDEVYEWFISFVSIDAYDWVMKPNIYGMGTYADSGVMMTRPYFSSSNYIDKMSDRFKTLSKDGRERCKELYDAIYYNFISKNKEKLSKNYFTARNVAHYNKKTASQKREISRIANDFIRKNCK